MSVKWYGKEVLSNMELATKAGLTAAAMVVQGQAVLLCPVDTGRLRQSINYRVSNTEAAIGTNVEYAPYVEFGTKRMKAQPFLRPALDDVKDEVRDIFKKEYIRALK